MVLGETLYNFGFVLTWWGILGLLFTIFAMPVVWLYVSANVAMFSGYALMWMGQTGYRRVTPPLRPIRPPSPSTHPQIPVKKRVRE